MKIRNTTAIFSVLIALTAFALEANAKVPSLGGRTASSKLATTATFGDVEDYQIGDVWGKLPLTAADVNSGSAALQRAARATARYAGFMGGATGFYMGKFNGEHVMGTNHHVVDGVGCRGVSLIFPFLSNSSVTVKCKRIIGHWTDIDFGMIVLDIPADKESLFLNHGVNFAFERSIERGTELLTVGFGIAKNSGQKNMMVNVDNDCKVYSANNDFKLMGDPDTINPGPYKAWSFAHGCDISHGDSGSAFFDRKTGEMLGIVWTAATPKDPQIRTRAYLDSLDPASPEIWSKLGYTVPAAKVYDFLKSVSSSLPKADSAIVDEILKK